MVISLLPVTVSVSAEEAYDYTPVKSDTQVLKDGKWYYANIPTQIPYPVTITGDVHLNIAGQLTLKKEISGNGHLHVYSQNGFFNDSYGQLICKGGKGANGRRGGETLLLGRSGENGGSGSYGISITSLTVNCCSVTATGGSGGAGDEGGYGRDNCKKICPYENK